MLSVYRKGVLNPSAAAGLVSTLSVDKLDYQLSDSNIDYGTLAASILNGKKKMLIFDNNISGDDLNSNLVYDSELIEIAATNWIYSDFKDGWFTPYLFYVEGYDNTLSGVSVRKNVIVYYNNTGNSANVDTGFYVYTGSASTYTGSITSASDWKVAETSDWEEFAKLILDKPNKGYTFKGELAQQQDLLTSYIEKALATIVINDSRGKVDKCEAFMMDYQRLDMKIRAAKERFQQFAFRDSQAIIETALELVEETNCFKYDIYR